MGEHVSTSCDVLFNKSKGKTSPPIICLIFRVLELKTLKIERGAARKKKGAVARRIYSHRNNGGGQHTRTQ
jgi:hypothetical protein